MSILIYMSVTSRKHFFVFFCDLHDRNNLTQVIFLIFRSVRVEEVGRGEGTPSNTLAVTKPTKAPTIQHTDQGDGEVGEDRVYSNGGKQAGLNLRKEVQKKEADLLYNEWNVGVVIQGK